jgi:protein TonB
VDFVRLNTDEQAEKQAPNAPEAPKGEEMVKEETETQVAQAPEVKTPPDDPKPAKVSEGAKGPTEPTKSNASLTKTDPAQPKQPEPQPVQKSEPTKPVAKSPAKAVDAKPTPTTSADKTNVVTSNKSDKVIEVPEDQTPASDKQTAGTVAANGTTKAGAKEAGQPAPGKPAEEKKPALPTNPEQVIAKYVNPVYPKNAANEKVEGIVHLVVRVEASGKVKEVKVSKSSGDSRLDNVALNTVQRGWSFHEYPYPYTLEVDVVYKASNVSIEYGDLHFQQ